MTRGIEPLVVGSGVTRGSGPVVAGSRDAGPDDSHGDGRVGPAGLVGLDGSPGETDPLRGADRPVAAASDHPGEALCGGCGRGGGVSGPAWRAGPVGLVGLTGRAGPTGRYGLADGRAVGAGYGVGAGRALGAG
ncbi:hypothetical protein [Raineyella sp. LH-20]|uniref:hypothetical protein n=1 Tax=Raineyella sp. LH-20 TaxID=3081204 RepID=UPI002953EDA2|nr:hypothetical protein [Raineyella sp. LH-20]WOP18757.1 hypothetical protein R0146_00315 [Raineyella sp. LH-20]